MKLGYYKLHAPKAQAEDWIWIVDHSVQLGNDKCFVILGIQASKLQEDATLSLQDVETIDLSPVKKSNGDIVYEQLTQACDKTGTPLALVGDKGSDLHAGANKFCKELNVIYIHDIKHKVALILKKYFENDLNWKSFTELATKTQKHLQQTTIAGASPPNQRSKARYMNIDSLVQWATDMLKVIDKGAPEGCDKKLFNMKVGWVKFYKQDIEKWKQMMTFAITTETLVRKNGITIETTEMMQTEFMELDFSKESALFGNELLSSVMQEESKLKNQQQRLLGSSEIIESLFGKFKNLEKVQSKSGFTSLILALPALVSKTTTEIINKAMEAVKVKNLKDWFDNKIGQSVQSQRIMFANYTNDIKVG